MTIQGPYVDGAWWNKPSETIFFCVGCANEREIPEEYALMYDDMPDLDTIECYACGCMVRDYE